MSSSEVGELNFVLLSSVAAREDPIVTTRKYAFEDLRLDVNDDVVF